jgi:hypothetical protein
MIGFDPALTWEAALSGRRGRQQSDSDAALQTCLTVKVLFGLALRPTTGCVETVLRRIGRDWAGLGGTGRGQTSSQAEPPAEDRDG